ncbi:trefoil factor 2 [Tachyglossus aculeatus]|uniref:trefoil factor 2 n=1 Tax=Tachyglossus aculeatus TaxID=9261 RepID=UPI0018F5A7D5|nr:trefoil factor 2 [Tachyglossus aculeatus]
MEPKSLCFLATVLIVGLSTLVEGSKKPSPCQCSRLDPKNRKNCGFPGISSDQCFASGCCFDTKVPGVPWCFTPLPEKELEECVMEVEARVNCGFPGISPEACKNKTCCFDDLVPQVPWCFYPIPKEECSY